MSSVTIVGSGASAVQFARSVLERGWDVTMFDVGRPKPVAVEPESSFQALKSKLADPWRYFLGARFEGVLFPGAKGEYYGFPPHKLYLFEGVEPFQTRAQGFEPLASFARGGLAEAWTGGSFPFNAAELEDWPIGYDDLAPFYDLIAERIGISGANDDLARFLPVHRHLSEPLDFDRASLRLHQRYLERRERLNAAGAFLGRSRCAVTRDDREDRQGCQYLGRCLWGCPIGALWTPELALQALQAHPRFRYVDGRFVERFGLDARRRVERLVVRELATGKLEEHEVERLVLAAGSLCSAKIVLDSIHHASGDRPRLVGLMDNRQVLLPFVQLALIGERANPDTYQYHQLALGFAAERPKEYVHGLVTTLKSALIHPIVQSVPLDLASASWIFKNAHAALGIVNVNFHDTRRDSSYVELEASAERTRLAVVYQPAADETQRRAAVLARVRRTLRELGCLVPPGMTHVRPMGASVHYSGLLPMVREARPLSASPLGQSHDFANLWLADGATFPFLPAKNLTFTLMANAARIAELAF